MYVLPDKDNIEITILEGYYPPIPLEIRWHPDTALWQPSFESLELPLPSEFSVSHENRSLWVPPTISFSAVAVPSVNNEYELIQQVGGTNSLSTSVINVGYSERELLPPAIDSFISTTLHSIVNDAASIAPEGKLFFDTDPAAPEITRGELYIGGWDGTAEWNLFPFTELDAAGSPKQVSRTPIIASVTSAQFGEIEPPTVTHRIRYLFDVGDTSALATGSISTSFDIIVYLDGGTDFIAGTPKVVRWLEVEPISIDPFAPGPIAVKQTPALYPIETDQFESTLPAASYFVRRIYPEELRSMEFEYPRLVSLRQIIDLTPPEDPGPETVYSDVRRVANVNISVTPDQYIGSWDIDYEQHLVENAARAISIDSILPPALPWITVEHYHREVAPYNPLELTSYSSPYIYNSCKAAAVPGSSATEQGELLVDIWERTVKVFMFDHTMYDTPTIGTTRSVPIKPNFLGFETETGAICTGEFERGITPDNTTVDIFGGINFSHHVDRFIPATTGSPQTELGFVDVSNRNKVVSLKSTAHLDIGPILAYNEKRVLEVPGWDTLTAGDINIIKEEDFYPKQPSLDSATELYWHIVENELREETDSTQFIYVPRNELHDIEEPAATAPHTLYGTNTVQSNCITFYEDDALAYFSFGPLSVVRNVISLYEGRSYFTSGAILVGDPSVQIANINERDEEDGPLFGENDWSPKEILFGDCGQPFFNRVYDGCDNLKPEPLQQRPHEISLFNRTLGVREYGATLFSPVEIEEDFSVQKIDVTYSTFGSRGEIIITPHTKRTTPNGTLSETFGVIDISTDPPPPTDPVTRTLEVAESDQAIKPSVNIEKFHREVYMADGPTTIFGPTPYIGPDFYVYPEYADTAKYSDPWVSRSPQIVLCDEAETMDDLWGSFYDKMSIRQKPQVIGPLGVSTTLFGLTKIRRA